MLGDKALKPHQTTWGYHVVGISIGGKVKTRSVHSLVAEAFHGPRPDGHVVNHKNSIRTDNRPENLEWVTPQQNVRHAMLAGRHSSCGENNPKAKLRAYDVADIRAMIARGWSDEHIASTFSVSDGTIGRIRRGESWVSQSRASGG